MPPAFNPDQPLQGILKEKYVSFNLRRSSDNYTKAQKKIVLLNPLQQRKTIIPGIKKKNFLEAALIAKGAIRKDVLDFVREKMKNI